MAEGQVGMIPSGGAYGYAATTDPESDQTTHELNVNVAIADISGLVAALAAKAPLASPAFTGTFGVAGTTPHAQEAFIDPSTITTAQIGQLLIDFGFMAAS